MRILIVDDSTTVRGYHGKILTAAGHQVEFAFNGIEGLEKALVDHFDLFLVDVNMPKMGGLEFVRQIRDEQQYAETPVMMVSTEAKDQDLQQGFDAGCDDYLIKPARPEMLCARVAIQAQRSVGVAA